MSRSYTSSPSKRLHGVQRDCFFYMCVLENPIYFFIGYVALNVSTINSHPHVLQNIIYITLNGIFAEVYNTGI
jgi:hypothetical protein